MALPKAPEAPVRHESSDSLLPPQAMAVIWLAASWRPHVLSEGLSWGCIFVHWNLLVSSFLFVCLVFLPSKSEQLEKAPKKALDPNSANMDTYIS